MRKTKSRKTARLREYRKPICFDFPKVVLPKLCHFSEEQTQTVYEYANGDQLTEWRKL